MDIVKSQVRMLLITGMNDIDPVSVYLEDFEPGRGRITITCWGSAWTCYWGAMSGQTITTFFIEAGMDYLLNKLVSAEWHKQNKRHEHYLARVIEVVKKALRENQED